jgi:hypothetical protein
MRLIEDCKGAWRHYSTQALAIAASIGVTWHSLPDWVTAQLPAWTGKAAAWSMTVAAVGGLVGKFVDQSKPDDAA